MTEIQPGVQVKARTSSDEWVVLRAASPVVKDGVDFPLVYLLEQDRWDAAAEDYERRRNALPWPVEEVEVIQG